MTPGQRAKELFSSGFYCAESVLMALAEAGGVDIQPGIATGLCSGMSRTAGTCGAVSGAILGLGLYAGRITPDEGVDTCYRLAQEFQERFTRQFGSRNCKGLLDLDFRKEEDRAIFKEKNRVQDCLGFSEFAADSAWELIREHVPE